MPMTIDLPEPPGSHITAALGLGSPVGADPFDLGSHAASGFLGLGAPAGVGSPLHVSGGYGFLSYGGDQQQRQQPLPPSSLLLSTQEQGVFDGYNSFYSSGR